MEEREGLPVAEGLGGPATTSSPEPVWVGMLDLDAPSAPTLPVEPHPDRTRPYRRARLLVRHRAEPIGLITVDVEDGAVDVERALALAGDELEPELAARLGPQWAEVVAADRRVPTPVLLADPTRHRPVSVVIATRNRPDHAITCVTRVLAQRYDGDLEVIVVDNDPATTETRDLVAEHFGADERVRYLFESEKGLSRARNIGLRAARMPITAFLSDDIQVDPLWLQAVARGFDRDPGVRCVVGYCPPKYLDTEEQLVFEQTMAWGYQNGFAPRLARTEGEGDPLFPYRVGIGNGANMIFDTEYFRSAGGFDQLLGPGTPARGGEDLDAPIRVLLAGFDVAFEPAALGWHADRYDDRGFGAHMYTYGLGLTALLARHVADRSTRWAVLRRVPHGVRYLVRPAADHADSELEPVPVQFRYRVANLLGRLAGPAALTRSGLALRKLGAVSVEP